MPKRERRSSAEIIQMNSDGTAIVEYAGKQYYWSYIPSYIALTRLNDASEFDVTIVHNFEHRAMIDITSVRKDEQLLRQEINPLKYKDSEEWVVDE
jgi:hypothetical protein